MKFPSLFKRRHVRPVLVVMRLEDMVRVHPDQVERLCDRCHHKVAIYPSGQQLLHDDAFEVVCQICHPVQPGAILVPGAREEVTQSVPRKKET